MNMQFSFRMGAISRRALVLSLYNRLSRLPIARFLPGLAGSARHGAPVRDGTSIIEL